MTIYIYVWHMTIRIWLYTHIYIYMTYGDTSNWGYPKMTLFYVVWNCLHHDLMVMGRRITLADPPFSGAGIPSECWWEGWGPDGSKWAMGELDWSWLIYIFSFWHVMVHYFKWHFGFWCPPGFLLVESPSSVRMHWNLEKVPNQPTKFDYASQNMWLKPDKTRMQADSTATGMGARISRHSLLARDSMCDVRHVLFVLDISCGYRIGSNLAASNIY